MRELTLGFSPCPNDTFVFHALVHGLTGERFRFSPVLADVEALNRRALSAELDVTKVSFGALPYLLEEYALLAAGGAIGRGCGPLLVSREALHPSELDAARIAIPGWLTTANLLFRLFRPGAAPGIEMEYHRIMPAIERGEVDAGLIIHESRFTYARHGLRRVIDLGEWWEETTGSPIPLGAIVARRSLGPELPRIETDIRDSVRYAFEHPRTSESYVEQYAQEMSPEVRRQHIALYVNEFTLDLGEEGRRAVSELMRLAAAAGILDPRAATAAAPRSLGRDERVPASEDQYP